jgi:hypothetical protein
MGISEDIIKWTCENSHFEQTRNYISLSHIVASVDELINEYKNGFQDSESIRLKCYKGYQMEANLLTRIKHIYGDRIKTNIEISVFDGLIKGHPDFTFDNYPADCKSVLMDEWLPKDRRLPRRIYYQMQAYMLYLNKDKGLVIFESRESGLILDCWLRQNQNIQNEVREKIKKLKEKLIL